MAVDPVNQYQKL